MNLCLVTKAGNRYIYTTYMYLSLIPVTYTYNMTARSVLLPKVQYNLRPK